MVQEKICNIVNSLEVQILYVQHKVKADFKTNFSKMVYGRLIVCLTTYKGNQNV